MKTARSTFHPGRGRPVLSYWLSIGALSLLVLVALAIPGSGLADDRKTNEPPAGMPSRLTAPPPVSHAATNAAGAISRLQTAMAPASSSNSMAALDAKHRLAIGDRLSFRIVEDEDDPRHLDVTDSGDLEVPYLGRFPAQGKSCKELAQDLKSALEKEYYYQATVIVAVDLMAKSRGRVYLVGPVRAPGPQEIPSDENYTLSKAILRAGGFTDFADKQNVRVTRKAGAAGGRDQTFIVNVKLVLEKGKTELDLPVMPGDFIYISERAIRF